MSHDHSHGANKKALWISFIITTSYMIIEAIGGFLTNSLALISDAAHMLSDSVSLGIGLLAFLIGEKAADYSKTFGYRRFEILAALFNGVTLILVSLYIFYEAYQRFSHPPEIASLGMLTIGILGLLVNCVVAWVLMRGDTHDNLNLRAAFLHVIGDMLGSVGAIVAALLIMFLDWGWADPLASVIVAVLVLVSGFRVTRDAVHILMEGTPKSVQLDDIVRSIKEIPKVTSVHDLHVWSITSDWNALSCHVVISENVAIQDGQAIVDSIKDALHVKGIGHVTIQLETGNHDHEDTLLCKDDDHS